MNERTSRSASWLPILAVSIPLILIFVSVLTVPLAAAQALELSARQTTSWIMALYGLSSLLSLLLSLRYRQPLLLTGNLFALVFIASLGADLSYPQLIGGFVFAGAMVLLVSILRLTPWLQRWIPAPVIFGLLAGAVVPFVSNLFTSLGEAPVIVGGACLAYLLGRRYLAPRVPGILVALLVGLALTALMGRFGGLSQGLSWPYPVFTAPQFTLQGILTVSPVIVVLITVQSNLPSLIFLRSEGFEPPQSLVDASSGVGTLFGSLLGPMAVSLSLPATALLAGEQAGVRRLRFRSVIIAGSAGILIALLAAAATDLPRLIPQPLLLALAGLAVLDVLVHALGEVSEGPLVLGPVVALTAALSDISLLGFGSFFWALLLGTGVTHVLERNGLRALQDESQQSHT